MLKRLILITCALILALPSFAAVREQAVTLPDDLGEAVIYSPKRIKGNTPGVIVVHEWWGLNDFARGQARKLAKEGFVAIAVDMYGHGKVATHPDDAQSFMKAAMSEPEKMNARFNAAKAALAERDKVGKIFAIGYCFGGGVVLNQARMGNDLAGVASFHGSLATEQPAEKGAIKARVLVATGAADPFVPPEQVGEFAAEMTQAGADLELLVFPGVLHSFTNPGATAKGKETGMPVAYDEEADKESWQALMAFIRE